MPTVLVTGADVGLGRAFVEHLLSRGFRVFAACHGLALRAEPGRDISSELAELPLEVTDQGSVRALVTAVAARTASLDLLINNAAVNPNPEIPLEELDVELARHVLDVNALGPLRVTQACLGLLERGVRKTILNVSSEAGSLATSARSAWFGYCMSKAALNMQTRILGNYLRPRGFRVFSVHPGWLKTKMAGFEGPLAPEVAAEHISHLLLDTADTPEFFRHDGTSHPW